MRLWEIDGAQIDGHEPSVNDSKALHRDFEPGGRPYGASPSPAATRVWTSATADCRDATAPGAGGSERGGRRRRLVPFGPRRSILSGVIPMNAPAGTVSSNPTWLCMLRPEGAKSVGLADPGPAIVTLPVLFSPD